MVCGMGMGIGMYVCIVLYAIREQATVYCWGGTRRMIYRQARAMQLSRREWPDSYCWWWSIKVADEAGGLVVRW